MCKKAKIQDFTSAESNIFITFAVLWAKFKLSVINDKIDEQKVRMLTI